MKRTAVWFVVLFASFALAGCGNKSRETAMGEALDKAAVETSEPQENFLIYEEGQNTVGTAVPEGVQTTVTESAAPVEAAAPVLSDKPTNEQIQQALKAAGLYDGPIDGKIGPKSKKAIRKFQIQNDLTVDGKVGKKTWAKMQQYLSSAAPAGVAETVGGTENAY